MTNAAIAQDTGHSEKVVENTVSRSATAFGLRSNADTNVRNVRCFFSVQRSKCSLAISLPAVALAAGKLMKLSPAKLAQAVNIALNDHIPMGQTRAQTLSDWKGLADAEASRNAFGILGALKSQ